MIRVVEIEDKVAIDELGNRYKIRRDYRGVNQKIWIEREGGEYSDSYLIKFSTRKPGQISELNLYTEVVCSAICNALGLPHVNYQLCEFTGIDGKTEVGVISQNYKKKQSYVEINGNSLHDTYCSWYYDNHYGEKPNLQVNTVYSYIEELKGRFESRKMTMSPETEQRLTEELLVLALFDFCTCQIDRHWGNVGWIHNDIFDDAKFFIGLLPIYDNECGCLLDEQTSEKLNELLSNIRDPKKVQKAIDMVNKKKYYSPYLGVKTALVKIKDEQKGFLTPLPNGPSGKSNAEILALELAAEIMARPNLKKVYDKICALDIEKLLDTMDFIPEEYKEIKEVYAFVWNTRLKLLKDSMEMVKNQGKGEKVDETGLSNI